MTAFVGEFCQVKMNLALAAYCIWKSLMTDAS